MQKSVEKKQIHFYFIFLHWVISLVNYENWVAVIKRLTAGLVPSGMFTVDLSDLCPPRHDIPIQFWDLLVFMNEENYRNIYHYLGQ
jgi:hypothetical protein